MPVAQQPALRFQLPAFAKINIGLNILRRRPDGYHELRTIFQQVSLADQIEFELEPRANALEIAVVTDAATVPADSDNLVCRAARAFCQAGGFKIRLRMRLGKQIPVGAGLGGGSADAATVLMALQCAFDAPFSQEKLSEIATALGADIPFFLQGGCADAGGIGEQLSPLNWQLPGTFLLVAPEIHISTKWAYDTLRIRLTKNASNIKLSSLISVDDISSWRERLSNDFEEVVFTRYALLQEVKSQLYEMGAAFASLSGSGSTLYGYFPNPDAARLADEKLHPQFSTFLVKTHKWGMREVSDAMRSVLSKPGLVC